MVFGEHWITFNCEMVHKVHLSSSKVPPKIRISTPLFWAQKYCGAFQHTGCHWLSTEFSIPLKSCPLPRDSLKSRMIFKWNPFVPLEGISKVRIQRSISWSRIYVLHGKETCTAYFKYAFSKTLQPFSYYYFLPKISNAIGNVKNLIFLFSFSLV